MRCGSHNLFFAFGILVTCVEHVPGSETSAGYRHDILPILSDRCFKCHGPDSATREAGLRLDRADGATAELDTGAKAIVPGSAAESALVERIMSNDPSEMMPPPESGKHLSDFEKAILKRWVEQGAKYEKHWAFVAPVRPAVPAAKEQELVRNPIDSFVLVRLEAENLKPSPRASKERLIRRLYFDLVGLPPTLAEIDAFIADDSRDAYEKVVDRLMRSPHYGERMTTDWLDGARFADSNGYQNDFARNMSPWRDWVIAAFNKHKRYDEFVVEQIAGDLLPNSTLDQRIATGFNRNHRTVTEAGSIEEEWYVENVVDRVETAGTVMLGLTIGCARCHDHKFDPFTQKEFYQLFAFFANVNEKGVYTETRGNVPPLVRVVTAENEKKLADFDTKIAGLKNELAAHASGVAGSRKTWLDALASSPPPKAPIPAARIHLRSEVPASIPLTSGKVESDKTSVAPNWQQELFGPTALFDGKQHLDYSGVNFPIGDRAFTWAVWVKPAGDGAILSRMDGAANGLRGCDLFLFGDRKIGMHIIDNWPSNAMKVVTKRPLPEGEWAHIAASYDGSGKAAGVSVFVNGEKQDLNIERDKLAGSFTTNQAFRVGMRADDNPLHATLADVQLFQHSLTATDIQAVLQDSLRHVLQGVKLETLSDPHLDQFDKLLLATAQIPFATKGRELRAKLHSTEDARAKYDAAIPAAMVMEERKEPREIFVLKRGRYDHPDKNERVQPDVPVELPRLPADAPRNRLGLARWLVSAENPLTARVIVNRLWQQHFGIGLVKTADNLGVQSEPPSHPELLDWLATELVASGWNLQHIQKLILMSNTYQQRAEAAEESYQRDPDNRLLARGPRYRLQSEAIRDNALAVSGLLVDKIGGPSVMPYQPAGLWEELAGGAHDDYSQGRGADLYRRSLYTYRKRTVPHPSMATFDAPSWEICQVKRARTNTPLQALALLNDVTYMEAARKLAERMLTEGGKSLDEQITFAFRLVTSRGPSASELNRLKQSVVKYRARFGMDADAAKKYVSPGESPRNESIPVVDLAAHTAVASILLNMDEAISKN